MTTPRESSTRRTQITRRRFRAFVACAALLLGAACDDTQQPPTPGTAVFNLNSTATDDGAILLTITGPGLTSVEGANSNHQVFWRLASEQELRVLVMGALTPGPLLTAQVPDVRRLDDYTVTVVEVAGRDDALRDVANYTVDVTRLDAR